MDQIKIQITTIQSQLQSLQKSFDNLGNFPKIPDDTQGALANRLFIRATAQPSTYTKTLTGTPAGTTVMTPADGFYELENGIYVPFFRRKT